MFVFVGIHPEVGVAQAVRHQSATIDFEVEADIEIIDFQGLGLLLWIGGSLKITDDIPTGLLSFAAGNQDQVISKTPTAKQEKTPPIFIEDGKNSLKQEKTPPIFIEDGENSLKQAKTPIEDGENSFNTIQMTTSILMTSIGFHIEDGKSASKPFRLFQFCSGMFLFWKGRRLFCACFFAAQKNQQKQS